MNNKKIIKAIKEFQAFLEEDMYTMFRPEQKLDNEVWLRDDFFKNKKDFIKYLNEHFRIFERQILEDSQSD